MGLTARGPTERRWEVGGVLCAPPLRPWACRWALTVLCCRVGGAVQSMVWDPTGERLAVIIRGQSCGAALLPAGFAPNPSFLQGTPRGWGQHPPSLHSSSL